MEEETIELYELQYTDLMALSSSSDQQTQSQRLDSISNSIMQNLGPTGPGLISISGIPESKASLPQALLPLARKLALLSNDGRKRVLKEHKLGSDVPLKNVDRVVSSFAMQMKYDRGFGVGGEGGWRGGAFGGGGFECLGFVFEELGFWMMELGLRLARVCDRMIGGGGCELERSLLESGTAKGRLIHYHSVIDNVAIKGEAHGRQNGRNGKVEDKRVGDEGELDLWQQWHYDYGIFTILTSPMFMLSNGSDERECESPSGHTYLQVFHPEMNRVLMVKASRGSFIVQVGESADVLSKGRLRATLHSVARPAKMDNLSRETFVVFLQPAWSKTFSLLDYPKELLRLESCEVGRHEEGEESTGLARKISEIVPPIASRLRDGMTFAEFSKETTKQYYGGTGLQSNR